MSENKTIDGAVVKVSKDSQQPCDQSVRLIVPYINVENRAALGPRPREKNSRHSHGLYSTDRHM